MIYVVETRLRFFRSVANERGEGRPCRGNFKGRVFFRLLRRVAGGSSARWLRLDVANEGRPRCVVVPAPGCKPRSLASSGCLVGDVLVLCELIGFGSSAVITTKK